MLTFDMTTPVGDPAAGSVLITVTIESDNEPASFEDTFKLWVNDIEVTFDVAHAAPVYTLTTTEYLLGPQAVKVTALAVDDDEKKYVSWPFSVLAEAVFPTAVVGVRAPYGELLAAYFAPHTRARGDKFSLYRQLMNPLAMELDEARLKLHLRNRALNPHFTQKDDPAWLYAYELALGEDFLVRVTTTGERTHEPPQCWGISGVNRLALTGKPGFRELWSDALPTRYTSSHKNTLNTQLTASTPIGELSFLDEIEVPVPGPLFFDVHSVSNVVSVADEFKGLRLFIEGENGEGLPQEESVALIDNGLVQTDKSWGKITKLLANDGPDDAYAEIVLYNFPPRNAKQTDPLIKEGEKTIRWTAGQDTAGSYLDRNISRESLLRDIALGEDSTHANERFRLADTSGSAVFISDYALDPGSFKVYGVTTTQLLIWDRRRTLPNNLYRLTGGTASPEIMFHPMKYTLPTENGGNIETTITVEIDRAKGGKVASRWYWSYYDATDTIGYLDENDELGGDAPHWKYNSTPLTYYGIKQSPFDVVLPNCGHWIFQLTVVYTDGTEETTRRVVDLYELTAIAEYKIDHLVTTADLNKVAVLEDGTVVITSGGDTWFLDPSYDVFIPDYEGSRILFREKYDSVEINFDEP